MTIARATGQIVLPANYLKEWPHYGAILTVGRTLLLVVPVNGDA